MLRRRTFDGFRVQNCSAVAVCSKGSRSVPLQVVEPTDCQLIINRFLIPLL